MPNVVLYGFTNLESIFDQLVDDSTIPVITGAIDATFAEYNRQWDAFWGLIGERTTERQLRYESALEQFSLQPASETGRARPIDVVPGQYTVGWPLQEAMTAWGRTYKASLRMTVGQVNNRQAAMLNADMNWLRDHALVALFDDTGYSYDDELMGATPVKGPANGDATIYSIQRGSAAPATDNHLRAQALGIDDTHDPFATIRTELTEHGENGGEVISFVADDLIGDVQGLAGFFVASDPNIQRGANTAELVGSLQGVTLPGDLLGYHEDKVWIASWSGLPDGYIVSLMTQGPRPVRMRESDLAQFRGFGPVADRIDYPYFERQYKREAGFGAWNRVGVDILKVGAGAYSVPTGFGPAPIP